MAGSQHPLSTRRKAVAWWRREAATRLPPQHRQGGGARADCGEQPATPPSPCGSSCPTDTGACLLHRRRVSHRKRSLYDRPRRRCQSSSSQADYARPSNEPMSSPGPMGSGETLLLQDEELETGARRNQQRRVIGGRRRLVGP